MQLRLPGCLLLLATCTPALAIEIHADIDRTRAGNGSCRIAARLPALVRRTALDQVAADVSHGMGLTESLARAGYRSTRTSALSLSGEGIGAEAAEMLASKGYCSQMTDAGLSEIGVYRDARQLWIVLAAPYAPAVSMPAESAGQRVLTLVNQARATPRVCGNVSFNAARPVRWNEQLARASRLHADDMARNNYFSHDGRDGSQPDQRVERAGYNYRSTAENIAAGQRSPEDAVSSWVRSPPHCANLMDPGFTEMGAAFAVNDRSAMGVYWAQEFGTRR